jgi:hypothetical protein
MKRHLLILIATAGLAACESVPPAAPEPTEAETSLQPGHAGSPMPDHSAILTLPAPVVSLEAGPDGSALAGSTHTAVFEIRRHSRKLAPALATILAPHPCPSPLTRPLGIILAMSGRRRQRATTRASSWFSWRRLRVEGRSRSRSRSPPTPLRSRVRAIGDMPRQVRCGAGRPAAPAGSPSWVQRGPGEMCRRKKSFRRRKLCRA